MKIANARYTSGRIALANLNSLIESLERRRLEGAPFQDLTTLSELLFLRGDLLGCIADHDHAEAIAFEAAARFPGSTESLVILARAAERFHRFNDALALLDQARSIGGSTRQVMNLLAALYLATGKFEEAIALHELQAREDYGIQTIGALATLSAEMGRWAQAEKLYAEAIDADDSASPLACAQLLFQWGLMAMRRGELDRAEEIFVQLESVFPAHVPGRGHRAEVALARGDYEAAAALIEPLLGISDDPEYLAVHAEILAARGNHLQAAAQTKQAAAAYEKLLAHRPEAYADHAAAFFMGVGNQAQRAIELAEMNWALRNTPRSRALLAKARQAVVKRGCPARTTALGFELSRGLQ